MRQCSALSAFISFSIDTERFNDSLATHKRFRFGMDFFQFTRSREQKTIQRKIERKKEENNFHHLFVCAFIHFVNFPLEAILFSIVICESHMHKHPSSAYCFHCSFSISCCAHFVSVDSFDFNGIGRTSEQGASTHARSAPTRAHMLRARRIMGTETTAIHIHNCTDDDNRNCFSVVINSPKRMKLV